MGRSVSSNQYQTASKKPWDGIYTERPVWGLFTMSAGGPNAWVYAYGANNRTLSIGHDRLESTNTGNRAASTITGASSETATGYYVTGNASTQVTSQGWSPTSGYFGINSNSQTALLLHAYAYQNGNIGYANTSNHIWTQRWAATQVMRDYEQQDYDLVGSSTAYRMHTAQLGASASDIDQTYTYGNLNLGGLLDTTGHTGGLYVMSYNRRTNTLALMFHCADNATGTKRIHIFKMTSAFSPNQFTTGASVVESMAAAKAAGGYTNYLVNMPTWHNNTSGAGRNGGKLVLCDDDSMWFVQEPYSNGSGTDLRLYSIVKNGNGYTATQLRTLATTTHYNSDAGDQYCLHHQNSDDNKYIAIYTQYYYYLGGYLVFIVNTASAAAVASVYDYAWFSETNNYAFTMAPSGGSEFVVSQSYQNSDGGVGPTVSFHNPTQRNSSTNNMLRRNMPGGQYPAYSSSTNYQSNFVFKYQPYNQYK